MSCPQNGKSGVTAVMAGWMDGKESHAGKGEVKQGESAAGWNQTVAAIGQTYETRIRGDIGSSDEQAGKNAAQAQDKVAKIEKSMVAAQKNIAGWVIPQRQGKERNWNEENRRDDRLRQADEVDFRKLSGKKAGQDPRHCKATRVASNPHLDGSLPWPYVRQKRFSKAPSH